MYNIYFLGFFGDKIPINQISNIEPEYINSAGRNWMQLVGFQASIQPE